MVRSPRWSPIVAAPLLLCLVVLLLVGLKVQGLSFHVLPHSSDSALPRPPPPQFPPLPPPPRYHDADAAAAAAAFAQGPYGVSSDDAAAAAASNDVGNPARSPPPPPAPPAQEAPALQDYTATLSNLSRDKWIGLGLAISSSLAIGTSFIITKKGLMDAAERGNGLASDGHHYLGNPIWWAGMSTMIVGEVANFAAYTFAPPILVTPLGALSVLIGAVLASFILKEELGRLGRVGCSLCLVGTVIIIMNAPEDREVKTVDEILNYAIQPGFLTYCLFVTAFAIFMIWRMVPVYGKRTPLVYISICSLVGSISVMSVKGFGVALKLTLDGNNQFSHPSTYCFAIVVVVCILVQMNYFNKALDQFSTNIVNPIYYVMFTTSTIFASFLLFRGFNTEGPAAAVSLLGGFVVIFLGVYLLNLNRLIDPVTQQPRMSLVTGEGVAGTGRLSEQHDRLLGSIESGGYSRVHHGGGGGGGRGTHAGRRSSTGYAGASGGGGAHMRRESSGSVLFNAYDNEEAVGLTQLNEASDESDDDGGMAGRNGRDGGGGGAGRTATGMGMGTGRGAASTNRADGRMVTHHHQPQYSQQQHRQQASTYAGRNANNGLGGGVGTAAQKKPPPTTTTTAAPPMSTSLSSPLSGASPTHPQPPHHHQYQYHPNPPRPTSPSRPFGHAQAGGGVGGGTASAAPHSGAHNDAPAYTTTYQQPAASTAHADR